MLNKLDPGRILSLAKAHIIRGAAAMMERGQKMMRTLISTAMAVALLRLPVA